MASHGPQRTRSLRVAPGHLSNQGNDLLLNYALAGSIVRHLSNDMAHAYDLIPAAYCASPFFSQEPLVRPSTLVNPHHPLRYGKDLDP